MFRRAMKLSEVANIAQLEGLLGSIEAAFGIPCSIVDGDAPIFFMADRHPLCAAYHAPSTPDLEKCQNRLKKLEQKVRSGRAVTSLCPMGLHDIAIPIMVENEYAGALVIGQFLSESKNEETLSALGKGLEMPVEPLRDSLESLPVISEKNILAMGSFFRELAGVFCDLGLGALRIDQLEKALKEGDKTLECEVTERTLELQRSERRLNEAQHIARMGSFERDLISGLSWWSDELYRLLGYEPGEIPSERETINTHVHLEDREAFLKTMETGLAKGEPFTLEFRVTTKQGKTRWCIADLKITKDDFGKPVKYSGSFRDVTQRRRIEQELRSVNKLQQLLLDNSIIGIALVRHRHFEWVNKRAASMAGMTVEEMTGAPTRIIYSDETQHEQVGREAYKLLSTGATYDAVAEVQHVSKGGVWCRLVGSALNPESPEEGSVWMFEDVMERRTADIELRRSRKELESILANSQVGIMFVRSGHFLARVNQRLADIFGYASPEEMEGMSMRMLHLSEERYQEFGRKYFETLAHEEHSHAEYRMRRKNGSTVWCSISGKAIDTNRPADLDKGIIWVIEDITVRKKAEAALRLSERRFRAIFTHAGVGICTLDSQGVIQRINHRMGMLMGYDEYDLLGMNISSILHPDEERKDRELRHRVWIMDIPMYVREGRYVRRDGHEIWGRVTTTVVRADDKTPQYLLQVVEDITERRRLEAELVRLARTDSLTGLNNRMYFMERGNDEFERYRRYGAPLCVMLMDIDHFKIINDTHGHHNGDKVLKKLAELCSNILRKTDVFGRIGGEEFAIVLAESSLEDGYGTAERIRQEVANTVVSADGAEIRFTISIGVTNLRSEDQNLEKTIQRADTLMYEAKRTGRNKVMKG